jgi:hypothetical protein
MPSAVGFGKRRKLFPDPRRGSGIQKPMWHWICVTITSGIGNSHLHDQQRQGAGDPAALIHTVPWKEKTMGLILLIVLILLLLGGLPAWPYSRGWGYAPSGALGLLLIIFLVLLLLGAVPWGYPVGPHPVVLP